MKLLRSYPMMSFALVLLSIVALCVAQGTTGLLIVSGALAALSWYITEGPRSKHLPRWVSNLLVIAVSLHVVVDLAQNRHDVLGVLGRFMVLLTLIKLYERRTPRDHAQLLTLSLLLMVTGCLESSDLLFGVLLVVYAVLGMYVLLLHQLYASYDDSRAARMSAMPAGYRLAPSMRPVTGRRLGMQFRSYVAAVTLVGLALSIFVFVLFPRGIGQGLVPNLEAPANTRRAGFQNDINLLTGTRISESRSVALEVTVLDSRGEPIDYGQPLLLRGSVLHQYAGNGKWQPAGFDARAVEEIEPGRASLSVEPIDTSRAMSVAVEPYIRTNILFTPYVPVEAEYRAASELRFDESTQLVGMAKSERSGSYTVKFLPMPSENTLEQIGANARGRGTKRELIPTKIWEIARGILRSRNLPMFPPREAEANWLWNQQAANAFRNYLQTGFTYTLDLSDVVMSEDGLDPVEQFLTQTKRGHCEYFASAMTLMCQSVGIRARVVTGFVAYNYDPAAQNYLVLQSNAHAWVEVQTGERRWTSFDPTPPDTLEQLNSEQASITDRLRWVYERFDGAWSSKIVEFDRDAQTGMTESIDTRWSQRFVNGLDSVREWATNVNRSFQIGLWGYIWLGVVGSAVIIAAIAAVRIARRLLAVRRKARLQHVHGVEYQRLLRQLGFYVDMLKVLDRAKLPKPSWQPPMLHAVAVAEQQPEAGQTMREISELFYAARYGGKKLHRDELAAAHRMVQSLAAQFHVKAPRP